jgi:hypothetical protein
MILARPQKWSCKRIVLLQSCTSNELPSTRLASRQPWTLEFAASTNDCMPLRHQALKLTSQSRNATPSSHWLNQVSALPLRARHRIYTGGWPLQNFRTVGGISDRPRIGRVSGRPAIPDPYRLRASPAGDLTENALLHICRFFRQMALHDWELELRESPVSSI